jgi:hypothetical protein
LNLLRPAAAKNVSGLGSQAYCAAVGGLLEVLGGTNQLAVVSNSCAGSEALARIALPSGRQQPVSAGQVLQRQHQSQQHDECYGEELHGRPGVVMVHPGTRRLTDGAPAFCHWSRTLGTDQVLAAHWGPSGPVPPGHFDNVGRS